MVIEEIQALPCSNGGKLVFVSTRWVPFIFILSSLGAGTAVIR